MEKQVSSIGSRYVAIYKVHGANNLADGAQSEALLALKTPSIAATLTINPDPYFLHINKSAALANQLLKGIFAPEAGPLDEQLSAEIEAVMASNVKQAGSGVFLVFEGEADVPMPKFELRRDLDDFAISLDNIDKSEIREAFRSAVQSVLTAIALSMRSDVDPSIQKVGEVIFLVDADSGKPIYTFAFQGHAARMSLAGPLAHDAIKGAAALATKLIVDDTIARSARLLTTSREQATDKLQAFIAAWSALEIFVNATFKATYEARWFQIMADGAPGSAKPVFLRFREVMSNKYRLADKFLIIASVLDPEGAADNAREFANLKKFRDGLLHALDTPSLLSFPTDAVHNLVLKFMKLHLSATR
jgi:hypothetical protein